MNLESDIFLISSSVVMFLLIILKIDIKFIKNIIYEIFKGKSLGQKFLGTKWHIMVLQSNDNILNIS